MTILESTEILLRDALQSAIIEQIRELETQEEEAREAGQADYADGISQTITTLAENFNIDLSGYEDDEEEPEVEEEEGDEEEPEEEPEEGVIPATKAILRALGTGVHDLNDGDPTDRDQADEVMETLNDLGYSLAGRNFVES